MQSSSHDRNPEKHSNTAAKGRVYSWKNLIPIDSEYTAFPPPTGRTQPVTFSPLSSQIQGDDVKAQEQTTIKHIQEINSFDRVAKIKELVSYLENPSSKNPDLTHSLQFLKALQAPPGIQQDLLDALRHGPVAAESLCRVIIFLSKNIQAPEYFNFHRVIGYINNMGHSTKILQFILQSGPTSPTLLHWSGILHKKISSKIQIEESLCSTVIIHFIADLLNHPRLVTHGTSVTPMFAKKKRKKQATEPKQSQEPQKYCKTAEEKCVTQQLFSTAQVLSHISQAPFSSSSLSSTSIPSLHLQPLEVKKTPLAASALLQFYLSQYQSLSDPEQQILIEDFVCYMDSLLYTPQTLLKQLDSPQNLALFLLNEGRLERDRSRGKAPVFFLRPRQQRRQPYRQLSIQCKPFHLLYKRPIC